MVDSSAFERGEYHGTADTTIMDTETRDFARMPTTKHWLHSEGTYRSLPLGTQRLKLKCTPSRMTINRIKRDATTIEANVNSMFSNNKKVTAVTSQVIEDELRAWVWEMWRNSVSVSDALIKEIGRRIQIKYGEGERLTFSNGWTQAFKRRNNFRSYRSFGEDGDTDEVAIENELPRIRARLATYQVNDIFNVDEYGVFYKLPPTSTIGPTRLSGRKKNKDRFTVLSCCNADGTERLPALFIKKFQKPGCFLGRDPTEDGFEYRNSSKAWMTQSLFFDWLLSFEDYISATSGRRAVLVLDNASCHGCPNSLPVLRHVEVLYLPKRSTSRTQPLDAGIIACIKRRFRRRQLEKAVDLIENGVTQKLYSMDLYTAMCALAKIWERLEGTVIHNCWIETGLLLDSHAYTVD